MKRIAVVLLVVVIALSVAIAAEQEQTKPEVFELKWYFQPTKDRTTMGYASGKIKNTTNLTFSSVRIECSIKNTETDEKVNIVQKCWVDNLQPGDVVRWKAEPPVYQWVDRSNPWKYSFRVDKVVPVVDTGE
jgi:hypothetical protein